MTTERGPADARPPPLQARLAAQLLTGEPARDPAGVAERLLAIQAQDPRGLRLAFRPRADGLTAADVDAAFDGRVLVASWLNRGTLHAVRAEDYAWLHTLTAPQVRSRVGRRLAQVGVPPAAADRGVNAIVRALERHGPLTRASLEEHVNAAKVRTERQALFHVVMLAALRGLVVRGPIVDGEQAYVLVADWLGPQPAVDPDRALAELARRYLAGHGPAEDRDLARWAGVPLRDARAGLRAIAAELTSDDGLIDLVRRSESAGLPEPRLLGPFDPLLLGWRSRADLFGADAEAGTVARHGMVRAVALVDGRPRATWTLAGGVIEFRAFASIGDEEADALHADADDVVRFLGLREPVPAAPPRRRRSAD